MPVIDPRDVGSKVALYTIDPGTTTAVARGIFPRYPDSIWSGLTSGKWESWEVRGEPAEQAWEIMGEFADWTDYPTRSEMRKQHVTEWYLTFEDFVLALGPGAASKRNLLDPVRVTYACDALCLNRAGLRWAFPEFQQASAAKSFATNERLRAHDMWVKGSEHRRDAVRHLCRRYATLVGE
jgi:hypothetical protein